MEEARLLWTDEELIRYWGEQSNLEKKLCLQLPSQTDGIYRCDAAPTFQQIILLNGLVKSCKNRVVQFSFAFQLDEGKELAWRGSIYWS